MIILVISSLNERDVAHIMGDNVSQFPYPATSVIFSGISGQDEPQKCPTLKNLIHLAFFITNMEAYHTIKPSWELESLLPYLATLHRLF